jgi:cholesterol oxidase
MATDFDVVVIGSGFGGAVSACRLAEAGYRVLILERGRRWEVQDYPRGPGDAWIWDQERPEKCNGWFDLRVFPNMAVAQGAAVGGGSLIYANVSVEAKPDLFREGWPPEITYDELKPYYAKVGEMLRIQKVPANQWTERTRLVKDAAARTGVGDRFRLLDLAVSFDENWHYAIEDPHNVKHSKKFVNPQGQEQGTCVHLGNCDIGCDVKAKNTLDLTYIPWAERHHAEVRPLHLVRFIRPENGGYRIHFDRIHGRAREPGSVSGRIVILAAGSLGSTELLLRCRDEYKTLPNLSRFLGQNWSSNGDFLTPAFHAGRKVSPTRGPTVTCAIDFLGENRWEGHHFFIEDGGFPDIVGNYLEEKVKRPARGVRAKALLETIQYILRQRDPLQCAMPWFAQGRDAADGQLYLRRRWWLFGRRLLHLRWEIDRSQKTIDAIVNMHTKLARATGGEPFVPPTWTLARDLITPHPLGGCNMGSTPARGVVNHWGEVFGYRNLYVADAAIIPEAIGANPSKTIAALAERIAQLIRDEGR